MDNDFKRLIKQLRQLDDEKKGLSRQVARARTAGEDCSVLIAEVKALGTRIKAIKAQLKAFHSDIREPRTAPAVSAPQFTERQPTASLCTNIVRLTEDNKAAWEAYVSQHPQATVYHSLKTLDVIRKTFHHQHLYVMALDGNDQACGVLPIIRQQSRLFGDHWISVPFFNYGGALGDSEAIEDQLMRHTSEQAIKLGGSYIEYRDSHPRLSMPGKEDKVCMLLALPESTEQLWQDIGSKVRAQIKRARSHHLLIKTGREELVDDFYTVFARNMRDLGTPVYSKRFFINMLKQHSSAHISTLYKDTRPIAAGFTLGWRNTLEIPWASTIRSANQLNANMLLYWEILRFAVNEGYEVFDFGRSSKDASTYRFKKQWGAQPHQLYWHYWLADNEVLPQVNPNNPRYRLLINAWKRLPVWLTRLIGPHIVKSLP